MSPRKRLFDSTVMIRMPDDLRLALQALAEKAGRSLSDYCRASLRDHVNAGAVPPDGGAGGAIHPKMKQFVQAMVREAVVDYSRKKEKRHGKA